MQSRLRALPSVDRLISAPQVQPLIARHGRSLVVERCRTLLQAIRTQVRAGEDVGDFDEAAFLAVLASRLKEDAAPRLRRVVNATGTILHTNLGRATFPDVVVQAIAVAAEFPVTLEYDLDEGTRGSRETAIAQLLQELTGADAATVVNNNAAAVLLALNTLAAGREVVVSRGELIEIGGSFRLPDIMTRSGATLREVGTTNRTDLRDYEQAITDRTGLLLKVHPSNYRIVGYTSSVELSDLVSLARRRGVAVMEDLGSGALVDLSRYGVPAEPVVRARVAMGADIVTFSGDKLLGGPQAGLIVGRESLVEQIARNPLQRALRCGKLIIAALEAVLRLYRQGPAFFETLPTVRAIARPLAELDVLGSEVVPRLQQVLGPDYSVVLEPSTCEVGSGALPTQEIASRAVAIAHPTVSADLIARRFRAADPPIVGRVRDGRYLLDLRTIFDGNDLVPAWETPDAAAPPCT